MVRFGIDFHFIKNKIFDFSVPHKYTNSTETEPEYIIY